MVADPWNLHIGSVWAQLFLEHSLNRTASVIEIGPGFADKIGLGLATQRFEGTLYVVEPHDAARRWVTGRYRQLLDRADIVPVAGPVSAVGRMLPGHADVVLMNHVLDDMVLHAALAPGEGDAVYDLLWSDREDVLPMFRDTWQRLLADGAALRILSRQILDDLVRLLGHINPRLFGASQYPSWFLNHNGFESVDRLGAGILRELTARVGQTSTMDRVILRQAGQDPDRWLFLDRHSPAAEGGEPAA